MMKTIFKDGCYKGLFCLRYLLSCNLCIKEGNVHSDLLCPHQFVTDFSRITKGLTSYGFVVLTTAVRKLITMQAHRQFRSHQEYPGFFRQPTRYPGLIPELSGSQLEKIAQKQKRLSEVFSEPFFLGPQKIQGFSSFISKS